MEVSSTALVGFVGVCYHSYCLGILALDLEHKLFTQIHATRRLIALHPACVLFF
jgi:hypothetical protein